MVVVPPAIAVARPPAVIVAVAGVSELHVTVVVMSCVVPSLNVPLAANCCCAPMMIDGFAGVTEIVVRVAAFFDEQPAKTRTTAVNNVIARAR